METKNKRKYALMLLVIMILQVILPTVQIVLNLDVSTVEAANIILTNEKLEDEDVDGQAKYNMCQIFLFKDQDVNTIVNSLITQYEKVALWRIEENWLIKIDDLNLCIIGRETEGEFSSTIINKLNVQACIFENGKEEEHFDGRASFMDSFPEGTSIANAVGAKYLIIGNNVTGIADNQFNDSTNNSKVEYLFEYDNVQTIGEGAFSNCANLQEIYGFNKVTAIGNNAFSNCGKLRWIDGFNGEWQSLENYDSVFSGCVKLNSNDSEPENKIPDTTNDSEPESEETYKLDKLSISHEGTTMFYVGEDFDVDGLKVKTKYISNKENTKTYTISKFTKKTATKYVGEDEIGNNVTISTNFDKNTAGTYTVTAKCNKKEATYDVTVKAPVQRHNSGFIYKVVDGKAVVIAVKKEATKINIPTEFKVTSENSSDYGATYPVIGIGASSNDMNARTNDDIKDYYYFNKAETKTMIVNKITIPNNMRYYSNTEGNEINSTTNTEQLFKGITLEVEKNTIYTAKVSSSDSNKLDIVIEEPAILDRYESITEANGAINWSRTVEYDDANGKITIKNLGAKEHDLTAKITKGKLAGLKVNIPLYTWDVTSTINGNDETNKAIAILGEEDGNLFIRGTGMMKEYYGVDKVIWNKEGKADLIKNVYIRAGITNVGKHSFQGLENLETVTIGKDVKTIGKYAFGGADKITKIILPENLEEIREGAFYNCVNLEEVNLPDKLTKLGKKAFYNTSIKEANIPEGITEIKYETFYNTNLEEVTLPSTLETIGESAFYRTNMKEIILPESLKTIGWTAFGYCYNLEKIVIPASVNSIAGAAFMNSGLKDITILGSNVNIGRLAFFCIAQDATLNIENLTKINDDAFNSCKNIKEVRLGENLEEIGNNAFYNCLSLGETYIPRSVTKVGENVFYNVSGPIYYYEDCTAMINEANKNFGVVTEEGIETEYIRLIEDEQGVEYEYNNKTNKLTVIGYKGTSNEVNIPDSLEIENLIDSEENTYSQTVQVIAIGDSAFCYRNDITSITLPDNLEEIGEFAFLDCINLQEFTIPQTVKKVGQNNTFNGTGKNNNGAIYYYPSCEEMKQYVTNHPDHANFQSIKELVITKRPTKTVYTLNSKESLDLTGMEAELYDGETHTPIDISDLKIQYNLLNGTLTQLDTSQAGLQKIYVFYEEESGKMLTTYFWVIVKPELSGIEVIKTPKKTTYIKDSNDKTDGRGGLIQLLYNEQSGDTEDTENTGNTGNTGNTQIGGEGGTTGGIHEGDLTGQLVYYSKDQILQISSANLTLCQEFYGLPEYVFLTSEDVTLSDVDTSQLGEQTITVTYEGQTDTFKVTVEDETLTELQITQKPDKQEYIEGQNFERNGMEVTAIYNNGLKKKVVTDYEVENGENLQLGQTQVTIKYTEGEVTKTATQAITVVRAEDVPAILEYIEITKLPTKMEYIEGESFDPEGLEVTAYYSNTTSKLVTDYEIIAPDPLWIEDDEVIIKYEENGVEVTESFSPRVISNGQPAEDELIISSTMYTIKTEDGVNYITGIKSGTTLTSMGKDITTNADKIELYDKDGEKLENYEGNIATAMQVKYIKGEHEKVYIIVVIGDVTGDGETDIGDVTRLAKHLLGKTTLTGAYLKAGKVTVQNEDDVSLGDITRLAKIVLGKVEI